MVQNFFFFFFRRFPPLSAKIVFTDVFLFYFIYFFWICYFKVFAGVHKNPEGTFGASMVLDMLKKVTENPAFGSPTDQGEMLFS